MTDQTLVGEEEIHLEGAVDAGPSPTLSPDHHESISGYAESGYAESLAAYMHTVSAKPLLTATEEKRLARRVRSGCPRAKNKLIERNLRLVIHNVKRYRGLGLDFEELLQEGILGLIRAVEKFDPDQGYKLSTYATWWINQKASRAVFDKGRNIRIPVHYQEQLRKLREAERALGGANGREASTREIAGELNVGAEKVEEMVHTRRSIASLDAPAGEDGSSGEGQRSALGELLADDELAAEMAEGVVANLESADLRHAVQKISEPGRSVLIGRYGLDGEHYRSLQELADWLGFSREVVRQYQKRAEKNLRQKLSPGTKRR